MKLFAEDVIEGYTSPVTGESRGARVTVRMGSFPKFLIIQVKVGASFILGVYGSVIIMPHFQRFVLEGLMPKKLPVCVHVEDVINLEAFRSHGLQPHEEELTPTAMAKTDGAENESAVSQLLELGFTKPQAVYSLKKHKNSLNLAAEWLFENAHEVPGKWQ